MDQSGRRSARSAALTGILGLIVAATALVLPPPVSAVNLLVNGSFESSTSGSLSPWRFTVRSGAAATLGQTNVTRWDGTYAAAVNVTAASTSTWLVQLSQSGLAFVPGRTYTVSFAARVQASRKLEVLLQETASPYTVRATRVMDLTTTWQTFSFPHVATSSSDTSLTFNLAAATGTVWIDAVSVAEATTGSQRLTTVADAYVTAASPSSNFGTATTLVSDGSPASTAYMKYDLTGYAGRSISRAVLRMKVANQSSNAQAVRIGATNAWTESGITYSNRPAVGGALVTFPGGALGQWVEVDVTSAVSSRAGQVVTLAIDSAGGDGYGFQAREAGADGVHLVVTAGTSGPTPIPTATTGPTATPRPSPTMAPAGGKGLALRPLGAFWGSNTAGIDADMAEAAAAGARWARIDLRHTSAPDPAFDAAVSSARSRGIALVVVVHKPAPLNDLGTEADRATYRAWLAQMVQRYRYHVKHWEIQNEPNLHYEWNIDDSSTSDQTRYAASVRRYVTLLGDAYQTVKSNDAAATVLFGGLSEWTVERYVDVLVTTDAYRYFDVMSFHPYGSDPNRVVGRFNSFKSRLSQNSSFAAKPIWVTETGFNTSWTNKAGYVTSEQQKADYLTQALRGLRTAGAGVPIFWYTLHEDGTSPGFGLGSVDRGTLRYTRYPAFEAFRAFVP